MIKIDMTDTERKKGKDCVSGHKACRTSDSAIPIAPVVVFTLKSSNALGNASIFLILSSMAL